MIKRDDVAGRILCVLQSGQVAARLVARHDRIIATVAQQDQRSAEVPRRSAARNYRPRTNRCDMLELPPPFACPIG